MLSIKMKIVSLWLRHKENHIFKWQIEDSKWGNKPNAVTNKIIIMLFSNVSKMSPNDLGNFQISLVWMLVFCLFLRWRWIPILKITRQTITKIYIFRKISEIKIFKRNDWEVNELCLSQMLSARKDIIKGGKYNEVWWDWFRRQQRWRTMELVRVLAGIQL